MLPPRPQPEHAWNRKYGVRRAVGLQTSRGAYGFELVPSGSKGPNNWVLGFGIVVM